MSLRVFAAAFAFAALGASSSFASTTLTKTSADLFGGVGSVSVSNISNHPGITAAAGGFRVTDGTNNLVAWCLDTLHFLNFSKPFETTNTPFTDHFVFDATQRNNLQKLFDMNLSDALLGNKYKSAGFQMALWEIIYELPSNVLNVSNGYWSATATASAVSYANQFLAALGGTVEKKFNLTFYQQNEGQNLVSALPVPLPAAGGMLLLALGALFGASRRKRASS